MSGYIYVRQNYEQRQFNLCKIGKTINPVDRNYTYLTNEHEEGHYLQLYWVNTMDDAERFIHQFFGSYKSLDSVGTELFRIDVLSKMCDVLNMCCKTCEEVDFLELKRERTIQERNNVCILRDYQERITHYMLRNLNLVKRIYLELATGGGKTTIIYNIIRELPVKLWLFVSPRVIVNRQNVGEKYLRFLKKEHNVYHYSDGKIDIKENTIITCCFKSLDKLAWILDEHKIGIWFDEAHWGVEERTKREMNEWLSHRNTEYHIFTSASPDREYVRERPEYFGELYSPIKTKELMDMKWLCPVKPYIYMDALNNPNRLNFMLENFKKYKCRFGFSFHNRQETAAEMFGRHLEMYKREETHIKPFLLLDESFRYECDVEYKSLTEYQTTIHSIAYVVAKYTMGYDFSHLDFIAINEPKCSPKDIIQCIGRGLRADTLGTNGTNHKKILTLCLPIYITENDYDTIIEVLRYLMYDIEIQVNDIVYLKSGVGGKTGTNGETVDGQEVAREMILDVLNWDKDKEIKKMTIKEAKRKIQEFGIQTRKEYISRADECVLPLQPEKDFGGSFKGWADYLGIDVGKYYTETEIKKELKSYFKDNRIIINHNMYSKIIDDLREKSDKVPIYDLWEDIYRLKSIGSIFEPFMLRRRK